ncbi:MAG: hypothetical protein JXR97_06760 [Planctomycetes bacterium]|nr:hypothetical protein [Planctomycetota bacterium]
MREEAREAIKMFFNTDGDSHDSETSFTFILAMDRLPALDAEAMVKTIEAYEPIISGVDIKILDAGKCIGAASFGRHRLRWIGIDTALPADMYEGTMRISHLEDDLKDRFRTHGAHVILEYTGSASDPIERYIAMYKVADCFQDGFCGLLNSPCNLFNGATTPALMRDYLLNLRKGLPLLMLVNVVTLFKEDGSTWYVSSGNHAFGVPEFAYLGASGQFEAVVNLFHDLLWNTYKSGRKLTCGDRLSAYGTGFTLNKLYEYEDYIKGNSPHPVYVLQPDPKPDVEESSDDDSREAKKSGCVTTIGLFVLAVLAFWGVMSVAS